MQRRLPPLNALKAFEAAARHLSFTRAADELFVTQAAVSHQIKALEEYLSMKLFIRRNRTLLLTEEGQAYFLELKDIFKTIFIIIQKFHYHYTIMTSLCFMIVGLQKYPLYNYLILF